MFIFRPFSIFLALLFALTVFTMFTIKHNVQVAKKELRTINAEINDYRRDIHVLKAEWSYLTKPNNLNILVRDNLNLKNLTPDLLVEMNSIDQQQAQNP